MVNGATQALLLKTIQKLCSITNCDRLLLVIVLFGSLLKVIVNKLHQLFKCVLLPKEHTISQTSLY